MKNFQVQDDVVGRLEKAQKVMDTLDEGSIDAFGKKISSVANDLDILNSRKQLLNVSPENLEKVNLLAPLKRFTDVK